VSHCYKCHSSKLEAPKGELRLDTRDGLRNGGATGAAIIPGKADESRLLTALRYADPDLQMPPSGKLPDAVIADFEKWIAAGAPDPRMATDSPAAGAAAVLRGMSLDDGRKWWAFQPLRPHPSPPPEGEGAFGDSGWARNAIDIYILGKLEKQGLAPSPAADRRTLARRVYVDLVGFKPSYEEIEAFATDPAPDAFEKLIERLLSSEHYGERWGRHWMDVARFAEDNPTGEATNPAYRFAWRYRDWIIEAVNRDVPYDKFVKLQLAADLMPGIPRDDLRALGYLGTAPVHHKDLRLSEQVIGGFLTDDWDERIDAISRGLLGITVACARCHDHKFDAFPTQDYYGLMGVFASTTKVERPLFDVEPQVELRYAWLQNRLFDLAYSVNLLTNEASTVVDSAARVARWKAEIEAIRLEALELQEKYPKLVANLERYWITNAPRERAVNADVPAAAAAPNRRNRGAASNEPFANGVFEAAQHVDGSDPQFTFILYKAGEARDVPVLKAGNVAAPGESVPRHFPAVLAKGDPNFQNGSGRLELAEKIFSDAAPLAARVIVNRVWSWHFGKPLVRTPSDFGVQGEKPTHPELLDDLAARFIQHGWSMKWLHREIVTSAAYRQASNPREGGLQADAGNSLLWRMNPRRLDIEAYRDTLLRVSGLLSATMYGPSEDLQSPRNMRRTVYGRVSRGRLSPLLRNYDFPDPMQTAGGRELTTTPLQQLFVMNSAFVHDAAAELAEAVAPEPTSSTRVQVLFRRCLGRDPTPKELDLALDFLDGGSIVQYAQVLLSTNEEIFWP
jgi:hypothetical protein